MPFLFNTVFEVLTTAIREEKERRGIQIGKEEVKLSPFTDDTMLYVENPKYATRKLLELITECGQVAGHKINTWKSCMYTLMTKYQEKKIRETISFTIVSERIKYLGINLPKEAKSYTLKTI